MSPKTGISIHARQLTVLHVTESVMDRVYQLSVNKQDLWNDGWRDAILMEARIPNTIATRLWIGVTTIESHHQWVTRGKCGTWCQFICVGRKIYQIRQHTRGKFSSGMEWTIWLIRDIRYQIKLWWWYWGVRRWRGRWNLNQ